MKQGAVFDHSGNLGPRFASLTIRVFGLSSAIGPPGAQGAPTSINLARDRHSGPLGTHPTARPKPLWVASPTGPTGTERFNPHNRYPAA
jgi:hypothetical protein